MVTNISMSYGKDSDRLISLKCISYRHCPAVPISILRTVTFANLEN
ncbi:hypothetical protein VB620_15620 [Nodularia harveyana UHCC-0300]|uniref:Uncharacterized protein n=1 Tax=Nodularia harveyana UHCC-0300 TaxID=2974287 RepID=A0ABU5UI14_9CYAN|nr:hypothetical protein [Nodularia harveyana]MEA5582765.1 hypothetical protein [Nodularia harveyana UHCC-0300]